MKPMMTMNDYRGPFTLREGPLVAKADHSQFAIGFIGGYGDGGAKLHRRHFGGLVK
jgi:hypothetical protein